MKKEEKKNIEEETIDVKEAFDKQKARLDKKDVKTQAELLEAKSRIAVLENEYVKLLADTRNLRKDLEKDQKEFIKYRVSGLLEDIIPVLNNFEYALSMDPPNPEMKNYLFGFKMIYDNLVQVLENEGAKQIRPNVGDKFNPDYMEVHETVLDEGLPDDAITKINLPGYKLHDRVVRCANVTVNKLKE